MTAIALPRTDWLARLRTIMVLRPGQRVVNIPGGAVSVSRRAVSSAAWWLAGGAPTPIAVYQPKGAASLAASYVNLSNPGTYDAAPGVSPTHASATGWIFDGVTQYLTTGVTPSNGNWTILARFSGAANTGYVLIEQKESALPCTILGFAPLRGALGTVRFAYGNITGGLSSIDKAPGTANGVLGLAGATAYRNGVADGTITNSFTDISAPFAIGARKFAASPADLFFAGTVQAVVIYSSTLTAGEVATVSAAMASL